MNVNELSIQEKVGQMLMIGMDTNYITERIKLNNEISALNTRYEELIEIKDFIYNQKVDLQFQLDEIKNSKRWKIIDKVSNSINRVRGK